MLANFNRASPLRRVTHCTTSHAELIVTVINRPVQPLETRQHMHHRISADDNRRQSKHVDEVAVSLVLDNVSYRAYCRTVEV